MPFKKPVISLFPGSLKFGEAGFFIRLSFQKMCIRDSGVSVAMDGAKGFQLLYREADEALYLSLIHI